MSELKLTKDLPKAVRKLHAVTLLADTPAFGMHTKKLSCTMVGLHMALIGDQVHITHERYPGKTVAFFPAGIACVEFTDDAS